MPHTRIWDETNPPNSQAAALGATRIRDMKVDITERMAIDHYWDVDQNTDGWHKKVTLPETTDPAAVANQGFVYTKDNGGITDLYYRDSAGTIYRLSGALDGVTLDWDQLTDIPGMILDIEGLADPGADSYLIWNDAGGQLEFLPITGSAIFAGYSDSVIAAPQLPAGWSIAHPALGQYTITHNLALATVNDLSIVAQIKNTGDDDFINVDPGTNSFDVYITDSGSGAANKSFFFIATSNV